MDVVSDKLLFNDIGTVEIEIGLHDLAYPGGIACMQVPWILSSGELLVGNIGIRKFILCNSRIALPGLSLGIIAELCMGQKKTAPRRGGEQSYM
jgi:hypothetical protein